MIFVKTKSQRLFPSWCELKVPCSSTAELKKHPEHLFKKHCDRSVRRLFPKSNMSYFFFLFFFPFTPNVRRPGTTGCPRNRLWACVCCVHGVSCERCSVWVRGKVFVSPSPGPSVCCVSGECVWCCGSSTGRKPDPGPKRRGPHLEIHEKVKKQNKTCNNLIPITNADMSSFHCMNCFF